MKQTIQKRATKLTLQTGKETIRVILSGSFNKHLQQKIICLETDDAMLVGLCIDVKKTKKKPSYWYIASIYEYDKTFATLLSNMKQALFYAHYYRKKSDILETSAKRLNRNFTKQINSANQKEDFYLSKVEINQITIQDYVQQRVKQRLSVIDFLV